VLATMRLTLKHAAVREFHTDVSLNSCAECDDSNCLLCTSQSVCPACRPGYFMSTGVCAGEPVAFRLTQLGSLLCGDATIAACSFQAENYKCPNNQYRDGTLCINATSDTQTCAGLLERFRPAS
jgi:hypothetical protein